MRASSLRLVALVAALGALAGSLFLASRAEAFVYWADSGSIGRANLDGSGVNRNFIAGAGSPCGVAVDNAHVYWANDGAAGASIGRANLDGTRVDDNFIPIGGDNSPCGVAVDADHVFWANASPGRIGRANVNGTAVDPSFITGGLPFGVAVDGGHVYWANLGIFDSGSIGRANLNGTDADQSFIVDGSQHVAGGVVVDRSHVYWTGYEIARANLNGTGVDPSFITADALPTCGIAVDAAHVYFEYGVGIIGRADLNGTGVAPSFITTGRGSNCGVAVDALSPHPPPPSNEFSLGKSPHPPPPSNDFSFRKVKKNKRTGTAKLTVNVPGAGELDLTKTKRVQADQEAAEAQGAEKLVVKSRRRAKEKLNEKGKSNVNAKVTYTPDGGEPNTESKKIKLIKR